MGFWFDSLLLELSTWAVILISTLYLYFQWSWTYWKKRGVTQLEPSFPFGDFKDAVLAKQHLSHAFQDVYNATKGERFVGTYTFTKPGVLLRDPELIKACLVKDFNHFHDRGFYDASEREPLENHLFALGGKKWRNLRVKLSPTFTSGKMKMMFPTMLESAAELKNHLLKSAERGEIVEVKDLLARFTTDNIASCAFGIKCNCIKNPDAEFRVWGRKLLDIDWKTYIFLILTTLAPKLLDYVPVNPMDKKISKYFTDMVAETVRYREQNNISRNDFMQMLIQLKNKGIVDVDRERDEIIEKVPGNVEGDNNKLDMNDLAAQAFVFYFAGFETSSTAMTHSLYELSLNKEIQRKAQKEVDMVLGKYNGKLTYEALLEMTYLDKVVSETLRKYPSLGMLNREVTIPYHVPGTNVVLEKGTPVVIPLYGLHHDPQYYPHPERFDPERFSEEEKAKRHGYVYMPFGEGPRLCIGMRFGLLQSKLGIATILSEFDVHPSDKTQHPPVIDVKNFVMTPLDGVWLKITKRNKT